ncbi:tetratricopeptide repeat protein [Streptomyces sp. NBC_01186]|uniref:tetratricopeptide repeat protein n=1 Tax=Streptomyces sp. NBC_01186 TaxID=2903765 RepID=UPI002E149DFF|nr:tetratricopeptide repeat protein [Streptomyces sp. NBC_01186]
MPEPDPPCRLPPESAYFVGRHEDMRTLDHLTARRSGDPRRSGAPGGPGDPATALVVSGPAGVGKTALVNRWLRRRAGSFGRILYADLAAHAPYGPAPAADVLERLLRALGVAPVPADPAERGTLWRALAAELPVAVLLDDAAGAAQVRPLLPAGGGSLAVVTSRGSLTALLADGAALHSLGALTPAAAVTLLARAGDGERTGREPHGAIDVVTLCACLPLPVRLAAAQLALHPEQPVGALAAALSRGLGQPGSSLRAEGHAAVSATLDESYRLLPPDAARTYRRLGLIPASACTPQLAAAVCDRAPGQAAADLATLVRAGLLEPSGRGGAYRFHDLVRAHACRRGERDETALTQEETVRRYADWCLHTATRATAVLAPGRHAPERDHRAPPPPTPAFAGEKAALAWLDAERHSLMAVLRHSAAAGWDTVCWQLADAMWPLFSRLNPSALWIEAHELGLAAARRAGSRAGEGRMLLSGAEGLREVGRYEEAAEWYALAGRHAEQDKDPHQRAEALDGLATTRLRVRELAGAEAGFRDALRLRAELADGHGAAHSRLGLGETALLARDWGRAVRHLARAQADLTAHGDGHGAARALTLLGQAKARAGDSSGGERELRTALAAFETLGAPDGQARTLELMGRVAQADGDRERARERYEQARKLARPLSPATVRRLEERLREL